MSCRLPAISKISGGQYPGSFADKARQSSVPVFLSNATTVLFFPPTRQINLLPSTRGEAENPQSGVGMLYFSLKSMDQISSPVSALRQSRLPSAPRVKTLD